jgi:hypothetical protein
MYFRVVIKINVIEKPAISSISLRPCVGQISRRIPDSHVTILTQRLSKQT